MIGLATLKAVVLYHYSDMVINMHAENRESQSTFRNKVYIVSV